ncbi:hypothetical protein HZ994_10385 [Akkermansiaceae bacterium]|nr:hypothetical protein HZ994_10385 [Akkermansiaceae bacterium]
MSNFESIGENIRNQTKRLIVDLMKSSPDYGSNGKGLRTAEIFRSCGLDWGDYPKTKSTAQQYWVVAAIRELESEGIVERVSESGPWRIL